jgi:hypothetical protein
MGAVGLAAQEASEWDQPAAALAGQIAEVLGPGPARLTMRNLSTIANDEVPAIHAVIDRDLKAHGVSAGGDENANAIRVTLSENARERLWVAEIVEGNQTKVVMVSLESGPQSAAQTKPTIVLQMTRFMSTGELEWARMTPADEPVLAVADTRNGPIALRPKRIALFAKSIVGWQEVKNLPIKTRQIASRDPRGVMVAASDGLSFTAFVSGAECTGTYTWTSAQLDTLGNGWSMVCNSSDDPWPIAGPSGGSASTPQLKAFYNASRDYFTGVVTPSVGVDLPPLYSAAVIPRVMAAWGLLIGGIDGKVQVAENGTLKAVSGTRDWGSDFAAMQSGCGAGTQIVASGAGGAGADSLRAYEIPAEDATAVSAPLSVNGTVMALSTAEDGKSVYAVVKSTGAAGVGESYEVDRVTASCN